MWRQARAEAATWRRRWVSMLFPPGVAARVPIAAVTGTNGKTTTARMLAHLTKMAGYTPGLTTTDGVYIDGQRTVQGDMTGPMSARMVLADPQIDMAVLETAPWRSVARRHGRARNQCRRPYSMSNQTTWD